MRKAKLTGSTNTSPASVDDCQSGGSQPGTTGRYIVVFRDDATEAGIELLQSVGLQLAVSSASGVGVLKEEEAGDADIIVYPRLGVAIVAVEPGQLKLLADAALDSSSPILAIEPEKIRRIIEDVESNSAGQVLTSGLKLSADSPGRGRSMPAYPTDGLSFTEAPRMDERLSLAAFDESQATWGLQITNVVSSRFSGREIRIAILDTGITLTLEAGGQVHYHPDFEGRTIVAETFVPGTKTAADSNGHGTHVLGTACGPLRPAPLPRYGIAHNAEIYVAKVADDIGDSVDGWIIAGIEWALCNGCQIISISLGSRKEVGESYSIVYENIALRALAANVLIIAAAGNCTQDECAVKEPADCPSIMAVGAINQEYKVASFSAIGINPNGGEIDIVAPGVYVYSSYRMPKGHIWKSGTSSAAPHVAGIAALYAEANPGVGGQALWDLLIKPGNVYRLPFSPKYVGSGLVQAP